MRMGCTEHAQANFSLQNELKPIRMGYYKRVGKPSRLNFLRT